jgi:hypothetical protein
MQDVHDVVEWVTEEGSRPYDLNRAVDKLAEERGLAVVRSAPNLLMLDLDTPEQEKTWESNKFLLTDRFDGLFVMRGHAGDVLDGVALETTSQSGNRHVYVWLLAPLTEGERIAMQAALGSDPKREMLNLARLRKHGEAGITLFEEYAEAVRVNQWLAIMEATLGQ